MKQCLYRAPCSFLSEAPVVPHSSDSGMSRWVGTCRQSTLTDPHSGWGGGATLPHFTVSIRVLGLSCAGLRCQLHPCLGVAREPRRRSAARTLCGHPRDALPAGSYAFPVLRPCDLTPPAVPRLRHGESTICCQALPQLPAASPRASVERRVSGRGPGPGAGTTSRPRAPPPSRTASSPINLTLIPLCQLCMPGPGLQQFSVSVRLCS